MSNEIRIVSEADLALVNDNVLNANQLGFLLKKTPSKYIRKRPAKGGGQWDYVSGGYVKKVLNLMFGWNWDFEITEQIIMHGEAIVKGKLTVRTGSATIVKTQFGNKDIMYRKPDANGEKIPLSIGNDLKAATTDCLKKCAAELGIAADIYNKEEFQELNVVSSEDLDWDGLKQLAELKSESIPANEYAGITNIIENKITKEYKKTFNYLTKL